MLDSARDLLETDDIDRFLRLFEERVCLQRDWLHSLKSLERMVAELVVLVRQSSRDTTRLDAGLTRINEFLGAMASDDQGRMEQIAQTPVSVYIDQQAGGGRVDNVEGDLAGNVAGRDIQEGG